jgi:hypothetical protein
MAQGVASNPRIPTVNQPIAGQPDSWVNIGLQLKDAVDVISGRAGGPLDRLASLQDLVTLGLVTETEVRSKLRGQG